MAGGKETKKKEAEALFPEVWWQSPGKKEDITSAAADTPKCNNLQTIDNNNTNYGSLQYKSNTSSCNNISEVDIEEQGNANSEVEEGKHSRTPSLIEQLIEQPSELLESLVDSCNNQILTLQRNINGDEDDTSDISNQSSRSNDNNSDDDGSSCDSNDSSQYYDEIEQPHRTLGLLFFDFIRFVAISANLRCVNTQLMPIFMCYGKCEMDLLSVVLRILITIFSLLLILVEFPDLFPFLQHSPNNNNNNNNSASSSTTTQTIVVPPLYITNWIPRGIFYIFLGIVCFEQSIVVRALDEARHASTSSRFFDGIFIVISAWFMLVVGIMYVIFGIFCIQKIMEKVRIDEKQKWDEYYKEVQQLELEHEEADDREWLLENGLNASGLDENGDNDDTKRFDIRIGGRRCWQKWYRWKRRCKRRKLRGGGLCYQLGCRTVDFRC